MNIDADTKLVASPTYMIHKMGRKLTPNTYQPGCGADSRKNASIEITPERAQFLLDNGKRLCKKCFA